MCTQRPLDWFNISVESSSVQQTVKENNGLCPRRWAESQAPVLLHWGPSPFLRLSTEWGSGNWTVLPRDRCWERKDAGTLHSAPAFPKSSLGAGTSLLLLLCATLLPRLLQMWPNWQPVSLGSLRLSESLTLDIYHLRLFFPQIASQPFTPNLFILFC